MELTNDYLDLSPSTEEEVDKNSDDMFGLVMPDLDLGLTDF